MDESNTTRTEATPHVSEETSPKKTEELLQELVTLIRQTTQQKDEPPLSGRALWKKRFQTLTEAIKFYWVWLPIVGFLIALFIYHINPVYFFAEYKIASDESAAKIQAMDQKKRVLAYYLNVGNTLLSAGKTKDAAKAFEDARSIDPFSLDAEYGYRKTIVLSFSEEKQFDCVVAKTRLDELESLAPRGDSAASDPHIVFARADLLWRTDPTKTQEVKTLLKSIKPFQVKHSAALALLGDIALSEGDFASAITHLEQAQTLSPNQWEIVNNLAFAYQLQADDLFRNNDREKGFKTLKEKVLPLYQRTRNLDPELIAPHIEGVRLNALINMTAGHPDLKVSSLIAQIENDHVQDLEKNKSDLFYTFMDTQNNAQSPSICSWDAKKAYLLQLQWLSDYFHETKNSPDTKALLNELKTIQETTIGGKLNLPWFLWNDLNTLKIYHPEWAKQKDVVQKTDPIMPLFNPEKI